MKYGIFADVHGNNGNLNRMFNTYEKSGINDFICLGDIIHNGDNYLENMCINSVRIKNCRCVKGDHDEISEIKTLTGKISPENIRSLDMSIPIVNLGDLLLFHSSLVNGGRIVSKDDAVREFEAIEKNKYYGHIAFYGHTHEAKGFRKYKNLIYEINFSKENKIKLNEECIYLINPGSIGMPSNGKPSFGILDLEKRIFEVIQLF